MSEKKAKKGEKDNRTPAQDVLLNFLKENKILIIVDETNAVNTVVPDVVYTVDKKPRVRVYYTDQIQKETQNDKNGKSNIQVA